MPNRWVFFLHILLTLLLTSNAKLGINSILCYNGQRTVLNSKCETGPGQQCGDLCAKRKHCFPRLRPTALGSTFSRKMSIAFDCTVESYLTSVIQVCFGYQFIILNKSKKSTQEIPQKPRN